MPMRRNLVQCSVVSTYDTAIAYTKNEDFNSGGTGGFTANTGTVSNPTGNQLHMTANWASKPLATTSVYLVNGRSYTLNLDIVGFSVVSGFSHTVRVRVVLPGAAFNTDFTTTGTKTITFTSNTTGYVNIEIRSIISPPTGVYSGNPYIDIDNFKVSWDSAFTSSDTICVSKGGYRYGFNGMEKVDEISGEGNGYDFGARMYDGRLGRWFSVDPLFSKYPSNSPYNFALNNPLYYFDKDGMDVGNGTVVINNSSQMIVITGDGGIKNSKVVTRGAITLNPGDKFEPIEITVGNIVIQCGLITRKDGSQEITYIHDIDFIDVQAGQTFVFDDGFFVDEDIEVTSGDEYGEGENVPGDQALKKDSNFPQGKSNDWVPTPNKGEIKVRDGTKEIEFTDEDNKIRIKNEGGDLEKKT